MSELLLVVNGTLMRGLELNHNLLSFGAEFIRVSTTAPCYRLWSINDRYPAMIQDIVNGKSISVEIWRISAEGLLQLLEQEPAGLCLGKVKMEDGSQIPGILGEPYLTNGQREITNFGGWREYLSRSTKG
ncbi:MAG: gamma-glutamylcyclotransferase [Anaerolineaceae bacterium]